MNRHNATPFFVSFFISLTDRLQRKPLTIYGFLKSGIPHNFEDARFTHSLISTFIVFKPYMVSLFHRGV